MTNTKKAAPPQPTISTLQGIALIFGTNIGAGILSLPYAARNGGFLALAIALAIAGALTTFSMMYIAEISLRTKEPLQLSGLAEKYLGQWGRWIIFFAIMVNSIGALVAYANGSGKLLNGMFNLPPLAGTLLFFILGSYIMYRGLHATGLVEGLITTGMAAIILILSGWTILGPGISMDNILVLHPFYIIPIMNLAVFTFMAQYVVPELVRGLQGSSPKAIPTAIVGGMSATGFTLALVPFVALGLLGVEVSEVVTLSWGEALGPVAYYMANAFALLAMFTSFIAIGYTAMRNILDITRWPDQGLPLLGAVGLTVLPPLAISLLGLGGFVSALSYAGGFAGAAMAVVPVLMLTAARKHGELTPNWQVTWQGHISIRATLIIVYVVAFLYSIAALFNILPKGWA